VRTYRIDSSRSVVEFIVLRGAQVGAKGTFKDLSGWVHFDDTNIAASSISAIIPIITINTGIGARDDDLKSPKYFECVKFPQASFRSQNISKGKDGKLAIIGFFELHGVKKLVTIRLDRAPQVVPRNGRKTFAVTGFTAINQEDYGLNILKLHPDGFVRIDPMIGIKVSIKAFK
jgi:polyisoprenoid-binding protein YceI